MASSMAHDINNPLASLSSYTHLLMTRTERLGISELTENLAKVEEDANRIGQLVKDLLWYSIPSDHTLGLVDIHEILKKSLSFASYLIDMEKIEIKREYFAKKPHLMANSRELIQAFINILTNAGEAMPDGGTIAIQTMSMDQEDSKKGMDSLCIKISDTGIGIPEENLARIFEQFFTTKTNGKGNGLGLYVVHAIIEKHHGHIEVESKVNQGTFFTIYLPVRTEQYTNLSLEEKG
jgi:signal transduction histidine kinase